MIVRLLSEAVEEANDAALWYGNRRHGLGDEFLADLQSALAAIAERPRGMPVLECYSGSHNIRRYILRRFPYIVVFTHDTEECLVVAVAHTRRRPFYWRSRLV
ncbi:MAG: type II toxin-antitoxin system RelE/ParE family toxin [Planctomycetota bacterium]